MKAVFTFLFLILFQASAWAQVGEIALDLLDDYFESVIKENPDLDYNRANLQKEHFLSSARKYQALMNYHFIEGKAVFSKLPPETQTTLIRHFEFMYMAFRCLPDAIQAESLDAFDSMETLNKEFRLLQKATQPQSRDGKAKLKHLINNSFTQLEGFYSRVVDVDPEMRTERYYIKLERISFIRFLHLLVDKIERYDLTKGQIEILALQLKEVNEFFTHIMDEKVTTGQVVAKTSQLEKNHPRLGPAVKEMVAKFGFHDPIQRHGSITFVTPLEVLQTSLVRSINLLSIEAHLSLPILEAPKTGFRASEGYDRAVGIETGARESILATDANISELKERMGKIRIRR